MGKSTIKKELIQESKLCTINTDAGASGEVLVHRWGKVVILTGIVKYPGAGIDLHLAYLPDTSWYPQSDIWISCDFYSNAAQNECHILSNDGHILFNQYVGGVENKIFGSWITK